MNRSGFFILLLIACICQAGHTIARPGAGDTLQTIAYTYQDSIDLRHPWYQSGNAAALSAYPLGRKQLIYAAGHLEQGDFRRPQQGREQQQLTVFSEGYQPYRNAVFYGKFRYRQQTGQEVRWTSILNPFRGTPYILADSIGGRWKKQLFELQAKAAAPLNAARSMHAALDLSYQTSTGARQNDPRPLSYVNELTVKPAIFWRFHPGHQAGAYLTYGHFQEEIGVEIRRNNFNYGLYKLKGLGVHDAPLTTSSGLSRKYNGHRKGAALQYGWTMPAFELLAEAAYYDYTERVTDNVTRPMQSGIYREQTALAAITVSWSRNYEQQLRAELHYRPGEGTEIHQVPDPSNSFGYITVLEGVFYEATNTGGRISYLISGRHTPEGSLWLIRTSAALARMDKAYVEAARPVSQQIDRVSIDASGEIGLRPRWRIGIKAAYQHVPAAALSPVAAPSLLKVYQELTIPDHAYLSSNHLYADASVRYLFRNHQANRSRFFIKGGGSMIRQLHTEYPRQTGQYRYGATAGIGILY